jgi:hypothetical protein
MQLDSKSVKLNLSLSTAVDFISKSCSNAFFKPSLDLTIPALELIIF